jgi:hypothetical protein
MPFFRVRREPRARAGEVGVLLRMVVGLGLIAAPATMLAQNCTLVIPPDPLGVGLATGLTYQLEGAGCDETSLTNNSNAFVQVAIIDTTVASTQTVSGVNSSNTSNSGKIYIYNPLIVNATGTGSTYAVAPVHPTLPTSYVAAAWFGFNGGVLSLANSPGQSDLTNANCQQGLGQFAYCNAVNFFIAANAAIGAGKLVVPTVGVGSDSQPCPTVRSFSVVDQDQSDNLTTTYLITAGGQMAQNNPANVAALSGATVLANPSDNWLLDDYMAPALGCAAATLSGPLMGTVTATSQSVWTVTDLTDPAGATKTSALALNELLAAANQASPSALIPLGDPFTFDSMTGDPNLNNVNFYRLGVDQVPAATNEQADTGLYCTNLRTAGVQKLALDKAQFTNWTSPVYSVATNLFGFLANRLVASFGLLNCQAILNQADPITLIVNGSGQVTGATIATAPPSRTSR